MKAFDGNKHYQVLPGDYCIARKNHLIRYTKYRDDNQFEKIIITFDEPFLKTFLERLPLRTRPSHVDDSFIFLGKNNLIEHYIQSLEPYYTGNMELDEAFADIKREELLMIILKTNPEMAGIFFNFANPAKIDLTKFMNQNFRFNISLERFAFLTGQKPVFFQAGFS